TALATYFADQIQSFQPEGPCVVAGFCAGGTVAFEVARTLRQRGVQVPLLVLFAAPWPSAFRFAPVRKKLSRVATHVAEIARQRSPRAVWRYLAGVRERVHAERAARAAERAAMDPTLMRREHVEQVTLGAVKRHVPTGRFDGRLLMVLPDKLWSRRGFKPARWRTYADSTDEYVGTNGEMGVLVRGPDTAGIAQHLARTCAQATSSTSPAAPISSQPSHQPLVTSR